MRDILQRLLKPVDPPRLFCTVESVLPGGRYRVVDEQRRKITIDGDQGYLPGTPVIIQSGRIVGTGSRPPATKKLKV